VQTEKVEFSRKILLIFSDRDLYFCRYAFQEHTKKFIPLRTHEGGNLELYAVILFLEFSFSFFQEEKEHPANWPSAILFTEELICRDVPSEVRDYANSLCRSDLVNLNVELRAPTEAADSGKADNNTRVISLFGKC
jgi:hypothetical protein